MAVDFFLKVDGVDGESADANHAGWIDIVSCGWGTTQKASVSGGGAGVGKVSFGALSIIVDMDKATPVLMKFCASGKHIPQIKVSMCKTGSTQNEYATILLKNTVITNVRFAGCIGSTQTLVYYFQAAQVEFHYWKQLTDGSKGPESQFGWDIKGNVLTM